MISNFFDFDSAVSQVIVQCEIVVASFKRIIMPNQLKRKNFAVVIKVLLEPIVWMSSSKPNFDVLFIFFGIRRINFSFFGSHELFKVISWSRLWGGKRESHIVVKFFGKIIGVINSENPVVGFKVH